MSASFSTPTWRTLVQEARNAVLTGDFARAEELKNKAAALKALAEMDGADAPVQRLPLPAVAQATEEPSATKAIEAAYVKKYGTIDAGIAQIYRELYGTSSYPQLRAVKMAELNRYLRTGRADDAVARQILLAPEQIVAAYLDGVSVIGDTSIKSTMIEAQDTLGGFLVPEEFNLQLVERLPGMTVVRRLARRFSTSRDVLSFMVRTGGDRRYIGAIRSKHASGSTSAGAINTLATFGKISIPVHVRLARVPVLKTLLEDSAVDIMSQALMPEFQSEAAVIEDAHFLTGSGVGEPQGILNGTAANGAPFNSDVTIVPSGNASTLTFDAIVEAPWRLAGQYRGTNNPSVAWAFTSATGSILAKLKDADNAYLWTETRGNNAVGTPVTLRGWQVAESESLPEVAANTFPVIFGDFSGYYIVDRIGMSVQRYEDSATAESDSVVFIMRRRYGGAVAEGYKFVVIRVSTT